MLSHLQEGIAAESISPEQALQKWSEATVVAFRNLRNHGAASILVPCVEAPEADISSIELQSE
jgi:hypothetical protein